MINEYSFVVVGIIILALVAFLTSRILSLRYIVLIVILTCVLLTTFQLLLRTNTNTFSSVNAFDKAFAYKGPKLLVLYSDF